MNECHIRIARTTYCKHSLEIIQILLDFAIDPGSVTVTILLQFVMQIIISINPGRKLICFLALHIHLTPVHQLLLQLHFRPAVLDHPAQLFLGILFIRCNLHLDHDIRTVTVLLGNRLLQVCIVQVFSLVIELVVDDDTFRLFGLAVECLVAQVMH